MAAIMKISNGGWHQRQISSGGISCENVAAMA
jgi:hypothetical protein